jgi:hypothetical protein
MVTEEQKARFDEAGNHPVAWAFIGENLLIAARRLEDDFAAGLGPTAPPDLSALSGRLQGPVLLLRGAAIECLLKALLVDEGKKLAVGGRYISPGGASHDLAHLASLTSLGFNDEERWLLTFLSFWINQGRYPVPARASDRDIKQLNGSPLEVNWSVEYERAYRELRQRIAVEVSRRTGYGRVE